MNHQCYRDPWQALAGAELPESPTCCPAMKQTAVGRGVAGSVGAEGAEARMRKPFALSPPPGTDRNGVDRFWAKARAIRQRENMGESARKPPATMVSSVYPFENTIYHGAGAVAEFPAANSSWRDVDPSAFPDDRRPVIL